MDSGGAAEGAGGREILREILPKVQIFQLKHNGGRTKLASCDQGQAACDCWIQCN